MMAKEIMNPVEDLQILTSFFQDIIMEYYTRLSIETLMLWQKKPTSKHLYDVYHIFPS